MKYIFSFIFLCCALTAWSNTSLLRQLTSINSYWKEQNDVGALSIPVNPEAGSRDWIRVHLSLVERTLRKRATSHLSPSQSANRQQCLNYLHEYWQAGNFPVNDLYDYRTPIFIDRYDNFCAVGYLIKASGNEGISRMIAAKTNLAYVKDMKYPELLAWADQHGFTTGELAWIQPTYGPTPDRYVGAIGKGTDGEVFELFADNSSGKLYVGGAFSSVDSTIPASNIAYVTESGGVYTWHNMGAGVNGPVYAITTYDNKVFVAGSFSMAGGVPVTNVAYWDGSAWHPAGCTYGSIYDLAVYNGSLYAAGDFDVCAALADVNLARWDGSMWQQHPGLYGYVNTIEVVDNGLVLGGKFSYLSTSSADINVIRWDSTSGYQTFANGIANEVKDLEVYGDTLYAVCKRTSANDSMLIQKLHGNSWNAWSEPAAAFLSYNPSFACNTLVKYADTLMLGGEFGSLMNNYMNVLNLSGMSTSNFFVVDSAVNKMVLFKNELILGGKFNHGNLSQERINSIARMTYDNPLSTGSLPYKNRSLGIYPNPAQGSIVIENDFNATSLRIIDLNGRTVLSSPLRTGKELIRISSLSAGVYVAEVSDADGNKAVTKLVIQ